MPSPFPKPYETVQAGRATIRFFHGDSLQVLAELPERSVDVVVTSPPYNLGIQYRTYDDGKPQRDYLDWTGQWVAAAARVLAAQGSLFLNVGAKPTEPWTALDVAQAARPHLRLQNILHWIKSIAIEAEAAGARAGLTEDLAVGHYKPINSSRFLNDCHEFVFHFTPEGVTRLDRLALGVKYQDASNVARWRAALGRPPLPRQRLVHPLRDHPEPGKGSPAPGDVPDPPAGVLPPPARAEPRPNRRRSVPRPGRHHRGVRTAGRGCDRHRDRRALPQGSDRPHPRRRGRARAPANRRGAASRDDGVTPAAHTRRASVLYITVLE